MSRPPARRRVALAQPLGTELADILAGGHVWGQNRPGDHPGRRLFVPAARATSRPPVSIRRASRDPPGQRGSWRQVAEPDGSNGATNRSPGAGGGREESRALATPYVRPQASQRIDGDAAIGDWGGGGWSSGTWREPADGDGEQQVPSATGANPTGSADEDANRDDEGENRSTMAEQPTEILASDLPRLIRSDLEIAYGAKRLAMVNSRRTSAGGERGAERDGGARRIGRTIRHIPRWTTGPR